ncbi:versican core protein, partial [Trichonephila clavata]
YYIVFSSKVNPENSEATFESEIFPPDEDEFCLTFYYQMSGKNLGALKVLKREGSGSNSTLWLLQGDQKKTWKKGRAIIQPTVEEYQIIFQGITGNGTNDFMAIDDIRIRKGELCKITPPEAEPLEDDLNTTYEPFNYTYDFKTSSEPSNYTYDFNTTYEPINSTYYRTSSTPAPRTTLKKHAICQNDRDCLNGGLCRKLGRGESFCDCPPLFVGEWCELGLCEKMHSKCRAMGAICKIAGLNAVCECLPGTIYRRKSGLCEDICDPWKCDHGKCQVIGRNYRCICDEGYTGSKCDQKPKQKQNVFAVWFIVLAVISMSTFVLLIGTLCFICHFKRSMGK